MLAEEINRALHKNSRIHSWVSLMYNEHRVPCTRNGTECQIIFFHVHASLVFVPAYHCLGCSEIFSASLPPTSTYLQRRELIGRLVSRECSPARGCLCCYRRLKCVSDADHACLQCAKELREETRALCGKWMVLKEVIGADVGREVMGWMLCFFARSQN
jgi:hypothetical protein